MKKQFKKNPFETGDIVELEIIKLASKGFGLGKIDNIVFFVPGSVVGDIIKLEIYIKKKSCNFGKIIEIIKKSEMRQESPCRYFPDCGGCNFQNMRYSEEIKWKNIIIGEIFRNIKTERTDIVSSDENGYRNKLLMNFSYENKRLICGFFSSKTHNLLNINHCEIQNITVMDLKNDFVELAEKYLDEKHLQSLRNIVIRVNRKNEILCCIVLNRKIELSEFSEKLFHKNRNIISFYAFYNDSSRNNPFETSKRFNSFYKEPLEHIKGRKSLSFTVDNTEFDLLPMTFFQVNNFQLENMIRIVKEFAGEGRTLLDLYSGIGFFGLCLRDNFEKIIFVEKTENSHLNVEKYNENSNLQFFTTDVSKVIHRIIRENKNIDCVILDPPRSGITEEVFRAIEKIQPEKIIMISCDPSTAARDLKLITESSYSVEKIIPLDNFPRTFHMETLTLIMRNEIVKND